MDVRSLDVCAGGWARYGPNERRLDVSAGGHERFGLRGAKPIPKQEGRSMALASVVWTGAQEDGHGRALTSVART